MSSNLKRKGGGGTGGDSNWDSAHVFLHPSQISHPHYATSTPGSGGFAGPYEDYEDYASELDYQHSAPRSVASSRRVSSSFSQTRSRSRSSTPPVGQGYGRDDSDYWSAYGIDPGGGLSSSSSSSSLAGLPVISRERLGRDGMRRLDVNGRPLSRRKGLNTWKLLILVLDRKSTRLNSSHQHRSRMPSSA